MTGDSRRKGRSSLNEAEVYAWWAGYGEEADRRGLMKTRPDVHLYATRLTPSKPLDVGMSVRLVALAKSIPPIPLVKLDKYSPYDPHRVSSIVGFGGGWVRVTVKNECAGNMVVIAGIDMPHVPGVTVRRTWLDGPEACLHWVGQTPEGSLEDLGRESAEGLCMAGECGLRRIEEAQNVPLRVWSASAEEREKRRPVKGESGLIARHKWLED